MPGPILHLGAGINCFHGGQAVPAAPPEHNVLVEGQPVVTQPAGHTIIGCINPQNTGGPCVKANWLNASTKVFVNFKPVLLLDSQGLSTTNGGSVRAFCSQMRVTAI